MTAYYFIDVISTVRMIAAFVMSTAFLLAVVSVVGQAAYLGDEISRKDKECIAFGWRIVGWSVFACIVAAAVTILLPSRDAMRKAHEKHLDDLTKDKGAKNEYISLEGAFRLYGENVRQYYTARAR